MIIIIIIIIITVTTTILIKRVSSFTISMALYHISDAI